MTNLIQKNRSILKQYHYVLMGNKIGYWAHINVNVLTRYLARRGENFHIILFHDSDQPLDFISIPYSVLKPRLKPELLYRGYESWKISIYNGDIKIHGDQGRDRIPAGPYYGNQSVFEGLKIKF